MSSSKNDFPKLNMKGWGRREFLVYSLRLGVMAKAWATHEAVAKPMYNIAFWRAELSTTILRASEMMAAVAVGGGTGALGISEISAAVAAGTNGDGSLGISEVSSSVALGSSDPGVLGVSEMATSVAHSGYQGLVSEVCVMVVAKV